VSFPFFRSKLTRQVEWDATKDKALWKILSKASKNSDIDCRRLVPDLVDLLMIV
jgi:hypothetical protein